MKNVIDLKEYKLKKENEKFIMECVDASLYNNHKATNEKTKSHQEVAREMQLGYMRLMTQAIQ